MEKIICCICGEKIKGGGIIVSEKYYHFKCFDGTPLAKKIKEENKMGCNESVVAMSAVRYMLGRRSYGVGCVCDFLEENKYRLTKSNIEVIVRDILEFINENPDITYKKYWLDVITTLKNL